MKFRVARHTTNLQLLIHFYTKALPLKQLGKFTDHDGYDGVFLGLPGKDWHLEFTVSAEPPVHQPDEDDLLVFYPETEVQYLHIINNLNQANIAEVTAKNPYWQANGKTYADADGYRIVIAQPE